MDLSKQEKTYFSESGEDGIIETLIHLFYGDNRQDNKYYVEFGAENGNQCNTRMLREIYQWKGLLMDFSYENFSIHLYKEYVNKENILLLLQKYQCPSHIHLLSIDIDSNDIYCLYQILKKYTCDIIVCEYNGTHLPHEDKIIRYDSHFVSDGSNYFGASLLSFFKLCNEFHYSLVYCNQKGVNCFFVQNRFLSFIEFNHVNQIELLYQTPKYGSGWNGGHPDDPLHRDYITYDELKTMDHPMKLLWIGPGTKEIPPKGWGAIESIIWDYYEMLQPFHHVEILNTTDTTFIIDYCHQKPWDIIHIMYDDYIKLVPSLPHHCQIIYTSHFAYLTHPEFQHRFASYFQSIFLNVIQYQSFISLNVLSQEIAELYRKYGFQQKIHVVPNGARDDLFHVTPNPSLSHKSIYIGKIEYRKRQYLYQSISHIDFVGNYYDSPFDIQQDNYLGEWDKDTLYQRLTEYGNLVLLSDGEADPLVVKEALMAGLGVVVSECAKANLDETLAFITVISNDRLLDMDYVEQKIKENRDQSIPLRKSICEYAFHHFSWRSSIQKIYERTWSLFRKVIIWGYPMHSHTHSYVHGGWYKAFQHLGYETHWFHDQSYPDPQQFNYEQCLFLTEGYADQHIPIIQSSIYLVHICKDPLKYLHKVKRLIEIRFLVDEIKDCNYDYRLDKQKCIQISDATYYQKLNHNGDLALFHDHPISMNYECLYMCWATDLLKHEIVEDSIRVEKENKIYWFGSYDRSNNPELDLFFTEAQQHGIEIVMNNPWSHPVSYFHVQEYMMKSIVSPDIRSSGDPHKIRLGENGTCHKQIGYIPCRIFKAISYGCLGITNSIRVYELLNKTVIYHENEALLFHLAMKHRQNFHLIQTQMDLVRKKHTFEDRIQDIFYVLRHI